MRLLLASAATLVLLISAQSPASAAAGQAMVQKPTYGQAQPLVEKVRRRGRYYRRRRWPRAYFGWGGPRVYGYYYRPYRYRGYGWGRRYGWGRGYGRGRGFGWGRGRW